MTLEVDPTWYMLPLLRSYTSLYKEYDICGLTIYTQYIFNAHVILKAMSCM